MIKSSLHISTIFLFLIIFISLYPVSQLSFATDNSLNPYIFIAPSIYVANETCELFNIDINISNVNNLHSVEFKLSCNASLLEAVQVVQGPFLPYPPQSLVIFDINKSAGFVWVNISTVDSEPSRSGNGTLARVTFNITFSDTWRAYAHNCFYSVLHLQNTSLFDDSMTPISHSSIDGIYFWKSLLPDPPIQGRLLDILTQQGGAGSGELGGIFLWGALVKLCARLTYNDDPIQGKLVAFQVIEPIGSTVFIRMSETDQNGCSNISFRIPMLQDSYGLWTAVAVAEIANVIVWDTVQFYVTFYPVGGFSGSVNIHSSSHANTQTYYVVLVVVMASIFIWIKRKMKRKTVSSSRKTDNLLILCGEKRK